MSKQLFENGTFRARAVNGNATLGYTSNKNEQVAVLLKILEGPDEGKHIGWYGYFTDATTERTLESLRYLGWQGDNIFDLSTIGDDDAPDVNIVIEDEDDQNGEPRSRVKWINRIGTGQLLKEKMTEEQGKAFAARMKGAILAHNKKGGTPQRQQRSSARPPEAPPHTDEDGLGF